MTTIPFNFPFDDSIPYSSPAVRDTHFMCGSILQVRTAFAATLYTSCALCTALHYLGSILACTCFQHSILSKLESKCTCSHNEPTHDPIYINSFLAGNVVWVWLLNWLLLAENADYNETPYNEHQRHTTEDISPVIFQPHPKVEDYYF